jgi:MFS family permease
MIAVSAIATVFTFALWIPAHSAAPIFVFAAISGFTSGAIFSVGPASIAQISELREIGVRNGTLFFCVAIGTLIGNPIGGALISANHGDYLYMEIFSGAILAASCAFFVISRVLAVGFFKKRIF